MIGIVSGQLAVSQQSSDILTVQLQTAEPPRFQALFGPSAPVIAQVAS